MRLLLVFCLLSVLDGYSYTGVFQEYSMTCTDDVKRPFIVYSPNKINKKKNNPLLVYLHGAISNPNLKYNPLDYIKKSPLLKIADEGKFILLFPFGQKSAGWFDSVGVNMVLNEIDQTVSNFSINSEKIFLSGFSDGGSGSLYFALNHPSEFAGFISFNGHLHSAIQLGESQCYLDNMNNKPLFIINTTEDLLYPSEKLIPIIDRMKSVNSNVIFKNLVGNHHMDYLNEQESEIIQFIEKNYKSVSHKLNWETSNMNSNSIDWLIIEELDTSVKAKNWHQNENLNLFNDKAQFGVLFDYNYEGNGLLIKEFKSDTSTGPLMELQAGDILIRMENDAITNPYSPYYYLAKKKAGDLFSVTVMRNNKEVTIQGEFVNGYYYDIFNFSKQSGKVRAVYDNNRIDIESSCVKKISLDFSKIIYKSQLPITIYLNKKKIIDRQIETNEILTITI